MSVSERILQAQQAALQRGEVANAWRQAPIQNLAADGLGDFKAQVHGALFERLGTRLFEATTEDQMQSLVMAEIGVLMDARESVLTPQERQRSLVEFLDALVQRRVRRPIEHKQFGISDAALQSIGETGGSELIATPDGDLRRNENSSQMCLHIMREDGIRLLKEIRHRLWWPAANECRE